MPTLVEAGSCEYRAMARSQAIEFSLECAETSRRTQTLHTVLCPMNDLGKSHKV